MTNNNNMFLTIDSDSDEDLDPIMIAAMKEKEKQRQQLQQQQQKNREIRWRYCTEPIPELIKQHSNSTPLLNLIALGRTGDGKSSLLNDLMGKQVFKQKTSAKSQTNEIQSSQGFWAPLHPYMHHRHDFGCQINVIDTPGFGDSQNRDQEFYTLIQDAIIDTATNKGGIHCILMVFKITTSSDTIFKSIQALYNLISPLQQEQEGNSFWNNVLLVFTHVDIVNGNTTRYQSHKLALKTRVNQALKEKYALTQDLPMIWISTQKYTCGFLKGLSDCDCERGNRYHSDCRRRLYEQVSKRKSIPFLINKVVAEAEKEKVVL